MDMNSCKPGDKLICRNGSFAYYLDRKGVTKEAVVPTVKPNSFKSLNVPYSCTYVYHVILNSETKYPSCTAEDVIRALAHYMNGIQQVKDGEKSNG